MTAETAGPLTGEVAEAPAKIPLAGARHAAGGASSAFHDQPRGAKAVQKLLGHESIQATGDINTDWDIDQFAETLLEAVPDEA